MLTVVETMASKNKPRLAFLKQRWPSAVLFVLLVPIYWWLYEMYLIQQFDNKIQAESQFRQAVEVGRLKVCLDNNIRPCDQEQLQEFYDN